MVPATISEGVCGSCEEPPSAGISKTIDVYRQRVYMKVVSCYGCSMQVVRATILS
jgi:hypothetical protein